MKTASIPYDLIIIGSGAGAVPAALAARHAGRRVLIVEKTELFGGSTAMSGGVAWLPLNPVGRRAGVVDSPEQVLTYLEAGSHEGGKGSTPQRRQAFVAHSPDMVAFLEALGMRFIHPEGYADYHEGEFPGGQPRSRSLIAEIYDLRRLGEWKARFRAPPGLPPIRMSEFSSLTLGYRTFKSLRATARVGLRLMCNRLGAELVGMGASLQGRLLELALQAGVDIELSCAVENFVVEDGQVVGVQVRQDGAMRQIHARDGVLIDSGGFARAQDMRDAFQQQPSLASDSLANPGDTGEVLNMALALGADSDLMDLSWWVITSRMPGGRTPTHTADMSKPHAILVDQSGHRFVNEATSYVEVGKAMFRRDLEHRAIPSWIILDSQHRRKYRWGGAPAGTPPKAWINSGYMKQAETLAELAKICGFEPEALEQTVARFNTFARSGTDEDFGRGRGAFHRYLGDPKHWPNPSLGTIAKAPFYAVEVRPGDVGTAGGLVTDEHARVVRVDGSPIPGLYATGNAAAPMAGRFYPGAGSTIGPAMVFGYIAAKHAIGRDGPHVEMRMTSQWNPPNEPNF